MHIVHLSSRAVGGCEGSSAGRSGRKESRRQLSPELGTQDLRWKPFQTFGWIWKVKPELDHLVSLDLVLVTGKSYIIKALVFPELPQCTADVWFEIGPSQTELLICHHEMSLSSKFSFRLFLQCGTLKPSSQMIKAFRLSLLELLGLTFTLHPSIRALILKI